MTTVSSEKRKPIPAPTLPQLYRKQREAITCPARYTIIEATTKAGKTAGCLYWILLLAWNGHGQNRNYWWVAPVIPQAKIAFRRLKRMLRQFDPQAASWEANETELRISLGNGAAIWFKGSDDPDGLYGEDVYGAVIDEATRCKEESWHAVRSTLTSTRGPIKIIGNVHGRKNWAYQLARRAESGEQGLAYFKLTAWDAVEGGILDAAEIEDARRVLPEAVFRELYLAEPSDDGGNPFGLAAIRKCVIPTLSTAEPRCYGVDLAKSHDWTVVIGMDAGGRVCRYDRWQSDWGQTIRRVRDMVGIVPSLIDSTGVGDPIVEELQRTMPAAALATNFPNVSGFKFSAPSKQRLMEGLASSIQQQAIGYPEGQITMELDTFEFEYTRTGVRYTAPEGLTDDCVCALALCDQKRRDLGAHVSIVGGGRPIIVSAN